MMSQMLQLIEESCTINFVSDQTFTGWAIKWEEKKKKNLHWKKDMSHLESRKCNLYYHYSVCLRRLINTSFRLWSQQRHDKEQKYKNLGKKGKRLLSYMKPH